MKLESRYFWIVLTLVGDSTTTSDFTDPGGFADPGDFADAGGFVGAGDFASVGDFFWAALAFIRISPGEPHLYEALAVELPDAPFDLERDEQGRSPAHRHTAALDDAVDPHRLFADDPEEKTRFRVVLG